MLGLAAQPCAIFVNELPNTYMDDVVYTTLHPGYIHEQ